MKRKYMSTSCFAISVLLFLCSSACLSAQTNPYGMKTGAAANWDRYRPSDLQNVIDEHSKHIDSSPQCKMNVNAIAANDPYRIEVVYMDEFRNISDGKKQLISVWGKSTRVDGIFLKAFEQEISFKDKDNLFWFPIQSQLIPHFRQELKKGDAVKLYVLFVGTVREGDQMQWVFIVNEFQKRKP